MRNARRNHRYIRPPPPPELTDHFSADLHHPRLPQADPLPDVPAARPKYPGPTIEDLGPDDDDDQVPNLRPDYDYDDDDDDQVPNLLDLVDDYIDEQPDPVLPPELPPLPRVPVRRRYGPRGRVRPLSRRQRLKQRRHPRYGRRPAAPPPADMIDLLEESTVLEPPPEEYDEDGGDDVTTYSIIQGGAQRNGKAGKDILQDSLGYTYTLRTDLKVPTWRCTVRPKGNSCSAAVKQVGDTYDRTPKDHNHDPTGKALSRGGY